MGSPSNWGQLVNFGATLRKGLLVPQGLFNLQDNLAFIASPPYNGVFSNLILLSPWSHASGYNPAGYRLEENGVTVRLNGGVTASFVSPTVIAILPVGFRPANDTYVVVPSSDGIPAGTCILKIFAADGSIAPQIGSASDAVIDLNCTFAVSGS